MKRLVMTVITIGFIGIAFTLTGAGADEHAHKHDCKMMKSCVVCKAEFKKEEAKFKAEFKGHTYYFCSEEHKAAFEKDPEKYMHKCDHETYYYCAAEECDYRADKPGECPHHGTELKKHAPKVVYVCPMDSCGTTSDKPGKCPKCGMELKKTFECCAKEHKTHEHHKEHDHGHK